MDSDLYKIVILNVGGMLISTLKSTLTDRESLLSAMFTNENMITYDNNGAVFIDRDPELFKIVLNWLRSGYIDPDIIDDRLIREFDYFGFELPNEISIYQYYKLFIPNDTCGVAAIKELKYILEIYKNNADRRFKIVRCSDASIMSTLRESKNIMDYIDSLMNYQKLFVDTNPFKKRRCSILSSCGLPTDVEFIGQDGYTEVTFYLENKCDKMCIDVPGTNLKFRREVSTMQM